MNDSKARDLAEELYNADLGSAQRRYTITNSNEEIVVSVTRVKKKKVLKEDAPNLEGWTVTPHGSNAPCPQCGGTGRI
jgi:hypothetical protein